jgi:hypothetical protein
MKDQLFLMAPGFTNAGLGPFYCGDSVSVEGLLGFFPDLRSKVDVNYIEFPRPRQAIVDLIGEDNQSVPVLVLAEDSPVPRSKSLQKERGRYFLSDEREIRDYLSTCFGLPQSG